MRKYPSIIFGIIGSVSLLLIYFVILTLANSLDHAIDQFYQIWYWIMLLTVGFGIQVGLYHYIKHNQDKKITGAATEMAASGGISTLSMIACCAHHLVDILPIIGLSAAAVFLVKYQTSFILVGVFSSLIGIQTMLSIIKKNHLYNDAGIFEKLFFLDIKKVRVATVILAVIIIAISFISKLK